MISQASPPATSVGHDSASRSDSARGEVVLLPSLPDEGWASMDLYWAVIDEIVADGGAEDWAVRNLLGSAPESSKEGNRLLKAYRKYRSYPQRVRGIEGDIAHILDHSYAHLIGSVPTGMKTLVTVFDIIPMLGITDLSSEQLARYAATLDHLKGADLILSVSLQTRDDLIERVGVDPERIRIVYPGTDLARFRKPCQPPAGWPEGKVVLSVGSLDPKKNLQSLPEILQGSAEAFAEAEGHFVRIGDPLPPEMREQFVDVIGEDRLIELGRVFGDDLVGAYQAASIFCMPSVLEGFSFTMMEAMAAGCPVLSNRCSTNPEVGGEDGAAYYEEGDAAGASAELSLLLSDASYLEDVRARGTKRVDELSWEAHWEGVLQAYADLMNA